jgi:hypothetical protein
MVRLKRYQYSLKREMNQTLPLAIAMGDLPNTFQALMGTLVRFNGAIQTSAKLILILSGYHYCFSQPTYKNADMTGS